MLIYIIDDENAVLRYTEKAIKMCLPHEEILTFMHTRDLLPVFMQRPADIVFLDIETPGIGGIELARKLNEIKPTVNLIFVTGYEQYAYEAFQVFASDYMKKPCTPEKIQQSLKKLRYPVSESKQIFIRTFGNFDVFCDGKPIPFRSETEKELLAYLVDREGALVSRQEMAGILFEDDFSRSRQVQLTRAADRLKNTLETFGVFHFFYADNGYRVDMAVCVCDMTEWKKGNPAYKYMGEYMEQYSFAEYRKGSFER